MPEFISKVQHKTYEKGEFSDEKVRGLDETIRLIKDFPYNAERTLTSVELTGPSVTIRNEDLNYMKVGLYFNGKYCVYYLDRDNHLYEYHAPELDDACNMVKDFFNGHLDLSKFEKHFINVGNQAHFTNKDFTYGESNTLTGIYFVLFGGLTIAMLACTVAMLRFKLFPVVLVFILLDLLYIYIVYMIVMTYFKARKLSLIISQGNNTFYFGQNDDLKQYQKTDVFQVNIQLPGRSSRIFCIMSIEFNNGSSIVVPGAIIDPYKFALKFRGQNIVYKNGFKDRVKAQWNFIKTP